MELSAGLHSDAHGKHRGNTGQDGTPQEAFPQHHGAGVVHTYDGRNLLDQANAEAAHVCPGTRLFRVKG
jgi:hypothetical protein